MLPKIYVDGQEGTTGLRIADYLATRKDLEVLKIDPEKRKDSAERKKLLNAADLVFLCLPDAASREAVSLIDNARTKVIDASTAFRTDPAWVFGLPELSKAQREKIEATGRVANPGCHSTGFILAVAPLVNAGVIARDAALTCFSLTGYSGGGKKMIAEYEDPAARPQLKSPRSYALKLTHKHLPEMQAHTGMTRPPVFTPVVCNTYAGMAVQVFVPLTALAKQATVGGIAEMLAGHYAGEKFVKVLPANTEQGLDAGCMDMTACNNTNRAEIFVFGHDAGPDGEEQIILITRLDNLGKGASGAAVQNMNLMLGLDEANGLNK